MSPAPDPLEMGWWLASRAAGVLALVCVAASVGIGLAMAARIAPRHAAALVALHTQTALVGLVAIAVHGIVLLGDEHLAPGPLGIAVPFVIDHARVWTGLGVTAGWLAAILGLSFWIRDRIGPARWRAAHRATVLVYVLAVAHTLGAGTDAGEPWLRVLLVATGAPVLYLLVLRLLPAPVPGDGFRRLRVAAVVPESATVTSLVLEPADRRPLPAFAPGQFLTVRVAGLVRSYSLSAAPDPRRWRISVKREPGGQVSGRLHGLEPGAALEASGPHGAFTLDAEPGRPVALVSAGIGVTPVLAMLAWLAEHDPGREVRWIHQARCGGEHAFAEETRALLARLPRASSHVVFSRPDPWDVEGRDHDATGRVTAAGLDLPEGAEVRICGPTAFVDALTAGLPAERVRSESFTPAPPPRGPAVRFARSGVEATWDERFANLLELAEAHDVGAQAGCRVGACGTCAARVIDGSTTHPVGGGALLCQARPREDVVLDL